MANKKKPPVSKLFKEEEVGEKVKSILSSTNNVIKRQGLSKAMEVHELHMVSASQINLGANCTCNCNENEIQVNVFDKHGNCIRCYCRAK